MHKSTFTRDGSFDEEVIFCLERQMIPAWEFYGLQRLAVTANTLNEFRSQSLPDGVQTWGKKRRNSRPVRNRNAVKTDTIINSWPEDDQHSTRVPTLIFVRKGHADVRIADYVVQCPEGHFILFPPGIPRPAGETPFLEEPRKGKECEIWWFCPGESNNLLFLSVCYSVEDYQINSGQYYIVSDAHVAQLFQIFSEEAIEKPEGYTKTTSALLGTFFRLFLREIRNGRFYNRGVDNLPKSAAVADSPIEMAKRYIDKNLNHPLTIDIVAQAVFMARTNFIRQFREETG